MSIIYTLGYARWSVEEVEKQTRALETVLVDVRHSPRTSKPGFSKTALTARLGDRYVHVPAFGNVTYKEGTITLADPDRGVEIVSGFDRAPILMCGCHNPNECHRSVVAKLLAQRIGGEIQHLRAPSDPAEPDLFEDTDR